MRMETTISLYGKGNEIISQCSLCVRSCLVLSSNYRYMQWCRQNTLHQIYINQIGNDNVCQGSKIIFGDDNIHSSSCVVGEKVINLFLYMSSTFRCASCNGISKCIMGCSAIVLTQATLQMDTQIIYGMTTLTL